jgi:hypothetical protein
MRYFNITIVLLIVALSACGCASLKPTSLTDAKNSCYTYSGPTEDDTCGVDKQDICNRFLEGLDQSDDYEQCIGRCEKVNNDVLTDPGVLSCGRLRRRADWLCRDYCRDNYR